ncbi:hypothetical protein EJ02DRAFT_467198 [Clathrospora elynae]|uniref:Uncharacterized protein n=1 Tax=Clathrospora elynae TaxID=706981 RepID=A0A6A5SM14_9PLEO|nr:hypothetical protein EJ02DRAFT_467198 [Clathrospora elynae]
MASDRADAVIQTCCNVHVSASCPAFVMFASMSEWNTFLFAGVSGLPKSEPEPDAKSTNPGLRSASASASASLHLLLPEEATKLKENVAMQTRGRLVISCRPSQMMHPSTRTAGPKPTPTMIRKESTKPPCDDDDDDDDATPDLVFGGGKRQCRPI